MLLNNPFDVKKEDKKVEKVEHPMMGIFEFHSKLVSKWRVITEDDTERPLEIDELGLGIRRK